MGWYEQQRITVIAYSPFAQGALLSGRWRQGLKPAAALAGKTPAQVALNWCLLHAPVITIPKTDRVERMDEACGASGWRLTDDQVRRLEAAFR